MEIKPLWTKLKNSITAESVLFALLYIAACFPFVTFIHFGTDLQPWTLLIAGIIFAGCVLKKKISLKTQIVKLLLVFFVYVSLIGAYSVVVKDTFWHPLRSYVNYISLLVLPLAMFFMFRSQRGLQERTIKIAINVWLIVGLVQKYIHPQFLYEIIAGHRTTASRGVVSLASEPSFYGYMCIFFLLFVLFFERHRIFYCINLCFQILFLASSSVTVVYMAVFLGCYLVSCLIHPTKRNLVVGLSGIAAIVLVWMFILPLVVEHIGGRMGELLSMLLDDPMSVLADGSIQDRIEHIVMALQGVVSNYGLPNGFTHFRMMSGYGTALYECGIPGLMIIVLQLVIVYKGNSDNKTAALAITTGLMIMMFSAVQLATPLYSAYLAYCCYRYQYQIKGNIQTALPEEQK